MKTNLSDRETDTILASLRFWQVRNLPKLPAQRRKEIEAISRGHGIALDDEEIEALCHRLNNPDEAEKLAAALDAHARDAVILLGHALPFVESYISHPDSSPDNAEDARLVAHKIRNALQVATLASGEELSEAERADVRAVMLDALRQAETGLSQLLSAAVMAPDAVRTFPPFKLGEEKADSALAAVRAAIVRAEAGR